MRIAIVETTPFGGLLVYAVQFADGLAGRGHDVDLISPRGNEFVGHESGATVRAVLTPPVRSAAPPPGHPVRRFGRRAMVAARLVRTWARIVWEARRGGYDVVLLNCDVHISVGAAGFLLLTRLPGGPKIANVAHNADILNRWAGGGSIARSPVVRAFLRRTFPHTDVIFVHGERSLREFDRNWPHGKMVVIPHGDQTVLGEPAPPAEEERLLFFGDWNRQKGLPVLVEAFDLLAERRPGLRATVAGRPNPQEVDTEMLKAWAGRHGDRVELIDEYVPNEKVPGLFARARLVVTPYVGGYQSGVIHLAMTQGRAVVTSDVGDLGKVVVDGETGLVVPPGDPEALADAIEQVVSDPALAKRFGDAGRVRITSEAGWDKVAAAAARAFEEVLAPER